MKLLSDERIERTEGEIKFTLKVINTSQQARLLELGVRGGPEARIELTRHCLKNIVTHIEINGETCDPAKLADQADLRDNDTYLVMLKIGQVVCNAVIVPEEDLKKP